MCGVYLLSYTLLQYNVLKNSVRVRVPCVNLDVLLLIFFYWCSPGHCNSPPLRCWLSTFGTSHCRPTCHQRICRQEDVSSHCSVCGHKQSFCATCHDSYSIGEKWWVVHSINVQSCTFVLGQVKILSVRLRSISMSLALYSLPLFCMSADARNPFLHLFTDTAPVYTPESGYFWWTIAKMYVNSADGLVSQISHHLVNAHLVSEAFAAGTCRELLTDHPVHVLLSPHFQGLIGINTQGFALLTSPEGAVTKIAGFGYEGMGELINLTYKHWTWNHTDFIHDLKVGLWINESSCYSHHQHCYAWVVDSAILFVDRKLHSCWNPVDPLHNNIIMLFSYNLIACLIHRLLTETWYVWRTWEWSATVQGLSEAALLSISRRRSASAQEDPVLCHRVHWPVSE